jgi:peptide/nickel transport system permease protein
VIGYVVRRLLLTGSIVVAVSFGAFVGFGTSFDPTGPMALDPTPQGHANRLYVQHYYHLTDPILSRYVRWVGDLFQVGFGRTVSLSVGGTPPHMTALGDPIGPQLMHAAGISAQLVAAALVLVLVFSALVGTVSAERRRFRLDISSRMLAYLGAAVPTFLIADLLARAIIGHQTVTIVGGQRRLTGGSVFLAGPPEGGFVDWLQHMTLPVVALALGLIGVYARYVRSSMLVALGEQYVVTARAKGLPERRVLVRHALRNSLIPVTSALSLELGAVIGASIAADGVFGIGGLATMFLQAVGRGDPFEMTALVVTTAGVVCVFMFVGDLLVSALDPRLRSSR